jgi:hypothetical protein
MPIKKIPNSLSVTRLDGNQILSFVTSSKKSHFTCSEAKLCEHIEWSTHTTGNYFLTYVSLFPTVAVHVYGRADILAKHADWLEGQISKCLADLHDDGKSKVK